MGTSIAAIIVLGSAAHFGWRGAPNILALPGIILAVILMIFMKELTLGAEAGAKKKITRADYAQVFKSRNVLFGMIMAFGLMAWWLTSNTFFALI